MQLLLMLLFSPLGGSLVIFTPFLRIRAGNEEDLKELSQRRKEPFVCWSSLLDS